MPTLPVVVIRIASTAPLFPTKNLMKSEVPAPEVDLRVRLDEAAVPPTSIGLVIWVVKVGESEKTAKAVPVSLVSAVRRLAEVKEPSDAALPTEVTIPVKLALVVTLPAVKEAPVPVKLVPTRVDGVPKFGVVKTGLVVYATTPVPDSSERMVAKLAEVSVPK